MRGMNPVPERAPDPLFLEIDVVDPSDFSEVLRVRGVEVDGYRSQHSRRSLTLRIRRLDGQGSQAYRHGRGWEV